MSTYFGKPNNRDTTDASARRPAEKYVSVPLYIGGAITQIAGLMAVAYQIADPAWTFAWFTILLTILGLGTSYTLRRVGAPTRLVKMGGALLAVVFIYALRNGGVFGAIVPAEVLGSQEMLLVSALAFTATFCSFLLVSDESVVFTCVWSIAIIGLTGTVNINRELIYCFVVFLMAASFLLVHQNGLSSGVDTFGVRRFSARSESDLPEDEIAHAAYELQSETVRPRTILAARAPRPPWKLIQTQLTMAGAAWAAALLIGFVVAIPVQMIGRNLSLATIIQRLRVPAAASAVARRVGGPQRLNFENLPQFQVGLGPLEDDPTEKMTVYSDRPSYWRGRIFDRYNGKGWVNSLVFTQSRFGQDSRSGPRLDPEPNTPPNREKFNLFVLSKEGQPKRQKTLRQTNRFHINSGSFSPLYHAAEPVQVLAPATVLIARSDNTMGTRFVSGYDYEVISEIPDVSPRDLRTSGTDYPREVRLQYLYSQDDNGVLRQLADEATKGVPNTPYDRAEAVRRFVAQQCTYTLEARPVPASEDAAEFFLTESKEGYCDLYATATTLLCRFAGIPARTVTGFAPGTPSEEDPRKYVLRGSDQHAWTEVYFAGYGWVPFDATQDTNGTIVPPRTPEPVKKPSLWERLLSAGMLPSLLMLTGIVGVSYVLVSEAMTRLLPGRRRVQRTRRRNADVVTQRYAQTVRAVARHADLPFAESMTPGEFEREVRLRLGNGVADALHPLTTAVENSSYGPTMTRSAELASVKASQQAVKAALRSVPRYRPAKPSLKQERPDVPTPAHR
ncbi:MAG: transglutaminase domain-containing protein [Cytophagales bacterium]|nr:transglutaminase domain-containing protein [Armatimonadota bacterium]